MESLVITEDQSTPQVFLSKEKGKFEISGNSLPEDVMGFYAPIISWIEDYIKNPNETTTFNVKLSYFNSASAKVILDILTLFDELVKNGQKAEIIWHYLEIDEDMLATGKEFEEMLKIPFTYYPYVQS
jgi:hypothetical protein